MLLGARRQKFLRSFLKINFENSSQPRVFICALNCRLALHLMRQNLKFSTQSLPNLYDIYFNIRLQKKKQTAFPKKAVLWGTCQKNSMFSQQGYKKLRGRKQISHFCDSKSSSVIPALSERKPNIPGPPPP